MITIAVLNTHWPFPVNLTLPAPLQQPSDGGDFYRVIKFKNKHQ